YRALAPRLTSESQQNKIVSFQSRICNETGIDSRGPAGGGAVNDFETVVFQRFPRLASLKQGLVKMGADPAMMNGRGSALFGLFRTREQINRAIQELDAKGGFPICFVSRARYRRMWWRQLAPHIEENLWPPSSRYAQ